MLLKRSLFGFLFICCFFLFPKSVFASNFKTDYHVTYTIDEDGVAHAIVNGTLTNTTSQFYATSYKIQLGFDEIANVKAKDTGGDISPQVIKNSDGYVIALNFNKQEVGLGNKQQFAITFDTPTLAHHYGRIWEIDIPGISNPDDFSTFVVALQTPAFFGQPAYIKPNHAGNELIFDKQTLGKSGISLAFGDTQVYSYHIVYHLRNTNLYPTTTQIALPPTTNYQDVSIRMISPQPENVIEDKDGNWLAQYHLSSAQNLDVTVDGNAVIHLTPKPQPESTADLNDYVKPQQYWETNNGDIQALAKQMRTPQEIYTYVINKLHYDFSRVTNDKPRLGAVGALQNPNSAVCREFTDLFIAIARAADIPAREVDGFAATDNPKQRPISLEKDILHVWPEYYDSQKKTWVMVDPTWGSTTGGVDYFNTLDFDHFAFAIKGESSINPIPAGAYKIDTDSSKDVLITYTTDIPNEKPLFSLESMMPMTAVAGLPIQGYVILKNEGAIYVPGPILNVSSNVFSPNGQALQTAGVPPFGSLKVPVTFNPTNPFFNTDGEFTIQAGGQTVIKHLESKVIFLTPWGWSLLAGVIILIILFVFLKNKLRK